METKIDAIEDFSLIKKALNVKRGKNEWKTMSPNVKVEPELAMVASLTIDIYEDKEENDERNMENNEENMENNEDDVESQDKKYKNQNGRNIKNQEKKKGRNFIQDNEAVIMDSSFYLLLYVRKRVECVHILKCNIS